MLEKGLLGAVRKLSLSQVASVSSLASSAFVFRTAAHVDTVRSEGAGVSFSLTVLLKIHP